jgi:hypothetical protein
MQTFGLINGFFESLQLVTTNNYKILTDLRTLHITAPTEHITSSVRYSVATSRWQAAAANNVTEDS